jgi:hypothetical protein
MRQVVNECITGDSVVPVGTRCSYIIEYPALKRWATTVIDVKRSHCFQPLGNLHANANDENAKIAQRFNAGETNPKHVKSRQGRQIASDEHRFFVRKTVLLKDRTPGVETLG